MSSTLDLSTLGEPIVAIALENRDGDIHFIYCTEPIKFSDIDFQEDLVRIDSLYIVHRWYDAIIICTEEILEELKQNL